MKGFSPRSFSLFLFVLSETNLFMSSSFQKLKSSTMLSNRLNVAAPMNCERALVIFVVLSIGRI